MIQSVPTLQTIVIIPSTVTVSRRHPCTVSEVFNFCWVLFVHAKGKHLLFLHVFIQRRTKGVLKSP